MSEKVVVETHWLRRYFIEILVVIALSFSSYIGITAVNNKADIASMKSEKVLMYDMVKEINTVVKDIHNTLIIKADDAELKEAEKQIQSNKEEIIKLKKK